MLAVLSTVLVQEPCFLCGKVGSSSSLAVAPVMPVVARMCWQDGGRESYLRLWHQFGCASDGGSHTNCKLKLRRLRDSLARRVPGAGDSCTVDHNVGVVICMCMSV